MASPHSADFAPEPPTSAHKVIGTLNLIFAGLLLMCGACTAINFVAQAAMQPMVEQMQGQMQESMHAERKAAQEKQLEALKQEAAEASDEADKARIEAEIAELEEKEEAEPPKFDMMAAYRDPQIIGFMWTDSAHGARAQRAAVHLRAGIAGRQGLGPEAGHLDRRAQDHPPGDDLRLFDRRGRADLRPKDERVDGKHGGQHPAEAGRTGPPADGTNDRCVLRRGDERRCRHDDPVRRDLSDCHPLGADAAESQSGLRRNLGPARRILSP